MNTGGSPHEINDIQDGNDLTIGENRGSGNKADAHQRCGQAMDNQLLFTEYGINLTRHLAFATTENEDNSTRICGGLGYTKQINKRYHRHGSLIEPQHRSALKVVNLCGGNGDNTLDRVEGQHIHGIGGAQQQSVGSGQRNRHIDQEIGSHTGVVTHRHMPAHALNKRADDIEAHTTPRDLTDRAACGESR